MLILIAITSLVVPTATTGYSLWQLLPPIRAAQSLRPHAGASPTTGAARAEDDDQPPPAPATPPPGEVTTRSLLIGGVTTVLGVTGFGVVNLAVAAATLGALLQEHGVRAALERLIQQLVQSGQLPAAVVVMLAPVLLGLAMMVAALCSVVPTGCALYGVGAVLRRMGLGWVVWWSLNVIGAVALAVGAMLVLQ